MEPGPSIAPLLIAFAGPAEGFPRFGELHELCLDLGVDRAIGKLAVAAAPARGNAGEQFDALVDGGNPASGAKTVAPNGSVSTDSAFPSGYSIIKADSLDAAVEIAKGCPVLAGGGGASIQVVETFNAM